MRKEFYQRSSVSNSFRERAAQIWIRNDLFRIRLRIRQKVLNPTGSDSGSGSTTVLFASEMETALPPIGPIEGHLYCFFQFSSQWESQKNRSVFIFFGKNQFRPRCISDHLVMSYRLCRYLCWRPEVTVFFYINRLPLIHLVESKWALLFCHKHHALVLFPTVNVDYRTYIQPIIMYFMGTKKFIAKLIYYCWLPVLRASVVDPDHIFESLVTIFGVKSSIYLENWPKFVAT